MFIPQDLRPDLRAIADLVPSGSSVLDIGCGNGELLAWLSLHKNVLGRGMEISVQGVNDCIAKGLSVIQGDAEADLDYYLEGSVDYVILSQSLQAMTDPKAMLANLVRIGKHAIVSIPNFGHIKNRLYLMVHGRMPVTKTLTYQWYDTPNIHFCTIDDLVVLCERMDILIENRVYVDERGMPYTFKGRSIFANLFGEQGIFLLKKC
jgi:methionine biosynthesis protein MetW